MKISGVPTRETNFWLTKLFVASGNFRMSRARAHFCFEFQNTICDVNRRKLLREVRNASFRPRSQDSTRESAEATDGSAVFEQARLRPGPLRNANAHKGGPKKEPRGARERPAVRKRPAEARKRAPHKFAKALDGRPSSGKSGHRAQAPAPVVSRQIRGSRRYY